MYKLVTVAAPDEAIWQRASADSKSRAVKRSTLANRPSHVPGDGKSEKSGRKSGA